MADFGIAINPEEHDERRSFDVIPGGRYALQAIAGDVEANSQQTGSNVWFQFEVLEGDQKGAQFRHYVNNFTHNNPDAQRIGQEEIAEFCRALNIRASKTEDFYFKPFCANVKMIPAGTVDKRKSGPDYVHKNDNNKIARYEPISALKTGAAPAQATQQPAQQTTRQQPAQQAQTPAQTTPAATTNLPAWKRPRAA